MIAIHQAMHVWQLLERREVAPIVHATFPLTEASEAHRALESGQVMGKLVLRASRKETRALTFPLTGNAEKFRGRWLAI